MNTGIIYDLDDLMVDSFTLHRKASEVVLNTYGHSSNELPADMVSGFVGRRVIDIIKETFEYLKISDNVDEAYSKRNEIFLELVKNELQAMPGLQYSLDFFKHEGFAIALASSGTRRYIDLVLDKFNLNDYFKVIITGQDVQKGKPDPESYIQAAKKLTLPPSACVVLEDATHGIESAKAAGCKCIAIQSHSTPQQDVSKADIVLKSLNNINTKILSSLFDVS